MSATKVTGTVQTVQPQNMWEYIAYLEPRTLQIAEIGRMIQDALSGISTKISSVTAQFQSKDGNRTIPLASIDSFAKEDVESSVYNISIVFTAKRASTNKYSTQLELRSLPKMLKLGFKALNPEAEHVETSDVSAHFKAIVSNLGFKPKRSFALCLSGGGLRALYFHLGVLSCLNRFGLLQNVRQIYCVSGGSIVAAHALLNWSSYCGAVNQFNEKAEQLIKETRSLDIRGAIVSFDLFVLGICASALVGIPALVAYFCPSQYSFIYAGISLALILVFIATYILKKLRNNRVRRLRGLYNKLYEHKTFNDAYDGDDGSMPDAHFLTTGMSSGTISSMCRGEFRSGQEKPYILREKFELADAVAASSAFPPFFPPVDLIKDCKQGLVREGRTPDHVLSDGGVFDNLGLRQYVQSESSVRHELDAVLISDASNPLTFSKGPRGFIGLTLRTIDILMKRIAELESMIARDSSATFGALVVQMQITKQLGNEVPHPVEAQMQANLGCIRTDLDRFSDEEITGLVCHGFNVALESLKQDDSTAELIRQSTQEHPPWIPDFIHQKYCNKKKGSKQPPLIRPEQGDKKGDPKRKEEVKTNMESNALPSKHEPAIESSPKRSSSANVQAIRTLRETMNWNSLPQSSSRRIGIFKPLALLGAVLFLSSSILSIRLVYYSAHRQFENRFNQHSITANTLRQREKEVEILMAQANRDKALADAAEKAKEIAVIEAKTSREAQSRADSTAAQERIKADDAAKRLRAQPAELQQFFTAMGEVSGNPVAVPRSAKGIKKKQDVAGKGLSVQLQQTRFALVGGERLYVLTDVAGNCVIVAKGTKAPDWTIRGFINLDRLGFEGKAEVAGWSEIFLKSSIELGGHIGEFKYNSDDMVIHLSSEDAMSRTSKPN